MKPLILVITIMSFCSLLRSQPGFELQFGGSNFLGATLNTSYELYPINGQNYSITPYFGIGSIMIISFSENAIVKGGLVQRLGNWGVGFEVSGFFENPFVPTFQGKDFIDMLVYPNFSFTSNRNKKIYFSVSLGAYFAFEKGFDNGQRSAGMDFAGDVIPGLGLTVGHRFASKF